MSVGQVGSDAAVNQCCPEFLSNLQSASAMCCRQQIVNSEHGGGHPAASPCGTIQICYHDLQVAEKRATASTLLATGTMAMLLKRFFCIQATSLSCLQFAMSCAAAGKPLAADTVATLLRGGLACLGASHAEDAARRACLASGRQFVRPATDTASFHDLGAAIISLATRHATPLLARSLGAKGLIPELLQVIGFD